MVEELERVLVAKLYHRVLQRTDLLKHLVSYLGVQTNGTVLELVEGAVESFVDRHELVFQAVHLVLVLNLRLLEAGDLIL